MNFVTAIYRHLEKKYSIPKGLIERNDAWDAFPERVTDVWLAGEKGLYRYKMPYFKDGEYQEYQVGQTVHLLTKGKYRGYYQIVRINRPCGSMGDYASWDDGKWYSFQLVDIKRNYKRRTSRDTK